MLDYGAKGDVEARLTCAFVADAVHDLAAKLAGREALWGVEPAAAAPTPTPFLATYRDPAFLAALAGDDGPRHLDADFELVQDTFRRFAEEKIAPGRRARPPHNGDVPEEIISGLAEMGAFGLSVPEEYGGCAGGGEQRLPRHGGGHRGAVAGLARHRRLAHHPARDPHPGPREGRHRGAEAASGCPSWPPPR